MAGALAAALPSPAAKSAVIAPTLIEVPGGPFITGSDRAEREAAYKLDEAAYGHSRTREQRWYENERDRRPLETPTFRIMKSLVTNRQYGAFIRATGWRAPEVSAEEWQSYGLIHPFERTRRHAWVDGEPPAGRQDHPVVLVDWDDTQRFAAWLGSQTDTAWRLPSEEEWEKAARGLDGRRFPWGDSFEPSRLNSHDAGPFDTTPVQAYPTGESPFGMLDAAGQVYEWTSSTYTKNRYVVKGGSWDDSGCGVCRPAARHTRPRHLKHILIGFRLVANEA